MRHKGVSKAEMAERMLEATGREFRRHGYSGVGVDALARQAGVTSGAFYSHFSSKGNAFQKVLEVGLDEVLTKLPLLQAQHGARWVAEFADYYLGKAHRMDLECGCAMAALTGDVVRGDKAVHTLFEKKMIAIAELIADGLQGEAVEDRRARAWALLGILIGGVNVARGVQKAAVADEIARGVKAAAVAVAGPARAPR